MKWIIVADAAKARVFSTTTLGANWDEVMVMSHPESRHKISDMYRDEPNITSSSSRNGNDVIEPATDLKEKEVDAFAREVSDFLEKNHHQNNYEGLYVIAAPNFLGALRPMLHKGVEDKIIDSISKNLSDLNRDEIKQRLQSYLDS